jgi:rRNA maturation endonuclease Nob1
MSRDYYCRGCEDFFHKVDDETQLCDVCYSSKKILAKLITPEERERRRIRDWQLRERKRIRDWQLLEWKHWFVSPSNTSPLNTSYSYSWNCPACVRFPKEPQNMCVYHGNRMKRGGMRDLF